jgi:hypothetical protein
MAKKAGFEAFGQLGIAVDPSRTEEISDLRDRLLGDNRPAKAFLIHRLRHPRHSIPAIPKSPNPAGLWYIGTGFTVQYGLRAATAPAKISPYWLKSRSSPSDK